MLCQISLNLYNYGRVLPGEIVKKITDFSVAGKRKLDVGFYSSKKLDQISEGIQRKKFLTLINTITVTLFNTILFNKMELKVKHNCLLKSFLIDLQ